MSGPENGFFDRLFAIKAAQSRGEAFQAASGYYSDLGFSNTWVTYASVAHDPEHRNQLRIDEIRSLFVDAHCDEASYLKHYNQNRYWEHDLVVKPFHVGNTRPFLYGGRFNKRLMQTFVKGGEQEAKLADNIYRQQADVHGADCACIIPVATPLSAEIPTGSITLPSSLGDAETNAVLKRAGIRPTMIAYALSEALSGQFRRLFARVKKLSARERECLQFIASGLRPQQIAYRIGISTHTVEFHLKSARLKLGAKSLPHAVSRAIAYDEIEV